MDTQKIRRELPYDLLTYSSGPVPTTSLGKITKKFRKKRALVSHCVGLSANIISFDDLIVLLKGEVPCAGQGKTKDL